MTRICEVGGEQNKFWANDCHLSAHPLSTYLTSSISRSVSNMSACGLCMRTTDCLRIAISHALIVAGIRRWRRDHGTRRRRKCSTRRQINNASGRSNDRRKALFNSIIIKVRLLTLTCLFYKMCFINRRVSDVVEEIRRQFAECTSSYVGVFH